MRKPSSAMILSVLLVASWLGFFAGKPHAAQDQDQPRVQWSYQRVDGEKELSLKGKEGWEAYAVKTSENGGPVTYFLKRRADRVALLADPVGFPPDRYVEPTPGQ